MARFKISSIREKINCYNIQLDEQLKMKTYSDAAIESRMYSFQGCLRETKDTSCLTFPESQNQHVGFIMAHIILKKKCLKMFWNITPGSNCRKKNRKSLSLCKFEPKILYHLKKFSHNNFNENSHYSMPEIKYMVNNRLVISYHVSTRWQSKNLKID